ncbi:hypothetical protein DOTSEDRAFT_68351 [Dothistroma septosporum NZE10]|uniref:BHLH domain-containing protein n=1 Tax=Dothistroma septosporum (strain NZE10 / CBS 128990) TaxID=675120 RepID=N1Q1H4_DOTSN|nr:hypothetical protein DOTSEDRAFT_68351 [Dothistroma septosporum NZE10]
MTLNVETVALFASNANELLADPPNNRPLQDVALSVADTMLLKRLSNSAHIRQPQVMQSRDNGWLMEDPPLGGQSWGEVGRDNVFGPLPNTVLGNSSGNERGDREDDDERVGSDRDGISDVKAEVSKWKSRITGEEKAIRVSVLQRPHAAVEKRYRQTVNTKLQQLYMSIPASGRFSPDERTVSGRDENDQAAKPVVLDKAIQYVQHLTETYLKYDADIEDLRGQLHELADRYGISEPMMQSRAGERTYDTA